MLVFRCRVQKIVDSRFINLQTMAHIKQHKRRQSSYFKQPNFNLIKTSCSINLKFHSFTSHIGWKKKRTKLDWFIKLTLQQNSGKENFQIKNIHTLARFLYSNFCFNTGLTIHISSPTSKSKQKLQLKNELQIECKLNNRQLYVYTHTHTQNNSY